MNYSDRFLRETASYSVLDIMLADIAVRIQLTPTDYQKAIDHFEAINEWIDREDSPLHGRVQVFYPQGGFMIGATTARHASDADFDIDVMAQVACHLLHIGRHPIERIRAGDVEAAVDVDQDVGRGGQ